MRYRACNAVALAAILTGALIAGPALASPGAGSAAPAAQSSSATPAPKASAKSKRSAYGRYCGPAAKRGAKARTFRACIDALARLAAGQAGSPRDACRPLKAKQRKAKGADAAYKRCVKAATRLADDMEDPGSEDKESGGAEDDAGGDPDREQTFDDTTGADDPGDLEETEDTDR